MAERVLAADERIRLAEFVHAHRTQLISSVLDALALQEPAAADAPAFVNSLLARLCLELRDGDPAPVDRLARTVATGIGAYERIAASTCARISEAYAAQYPNAAGVAVYLALRSSDLEKRFRSERTKDRERVDGSPFAGSSEIVRSLLSALEARDRITSDHARAVGIWSGRLAKTIGLSTREQAFAVLAGTLHDVGKIATPTDLLLKPGPLTVEEWEVMHSHSPIGARMLERIPLLSEFAPIVRAHHERFDGNGYPDKLAGEAIPMIARVLAVSDSFHAMISKRPYRGPISVTGAALELRRYSGTQWDPSIVAAMLSIVDPAVSSPSIRAARQ